MEGDWPAIGQLVRPPYPRPRKSRIPRKDHRAGPLDARRPRPGYPVMVIDTSARHLPLDGTRNVRDVGGYPAAGGRRIRWRTLLRSDELTRLPAHAQQELVELGVRQVIDLRWPEELDRAPNVFVRSDRVRYTPISLLADDPTPHGGLAGMYRHVFDARATQLADVVRALLADDGLPAVIGCAAGKDRTGVTVALLLDLAGVDHATIVDDYALSAGYFARPAVGGDRPGRLAPPGAHRGVDARVHAGRARPPRPPSTAAPGRCSAARASPTPSSTCSSRPHRARLMGKVGASLQLAYPAETVYRVATRIEDLPRWLPEVVGAELLDSTLAVGSRVRLQMGPAAGGAVVTGTVKQLRPPSIVAIGGSAGPLSIDVRTRLDAAGPSVDARRPRDRDPCAAADGLHRPRGRAPDQRRAVRGARTVQGARPGRARLTALATRLQATGFRRWCARTLQSGRVSSPAIAGQEDVPCPS